MHWNDLHDDTKLRWNTVANYWDEYMGINSNQFHRELIRPYTEQLLHVDSSSYVLDIACGNGNFSRRLNELGATVVAIDYSEVMIERAKKRTEETANITYHIVDALDTEALMQLGASRYTHAVSNMALMDMSDIRPLITALSHLLKKDAYFVFSIPHPCFQTPTTKKLDAVFDDDGQLISTPSIQLYDYLTPTAYTEYGLRQQSVPTYMFHRPLNYYMALLFEAGFVLDGFVEPSFEQRKEKGKFDWNDIPAVSIFRFRKV